MYKDERIKAVLDGKEPDRIPCSVWMHMSKVDQDPVSLAEALVEFNKEYDFDFIKLMPFGAYSTQDWGCKIEFYCTPYKEPIVVRPAIQCLDDYDRINCLGATYGTWGKTLSIVDHVARLVDSHTPYLQTIFSPATTLRKLGGARVFKDMKEHPEKVHKALEAITETTINFVKANVEKGVSGFFFATQTATYDLMDDVMYAEFCKIYDHHVIKEYCDKTWFNVMHVHGSNIMFDTVKNYPCNCLNWHDRDTKPSLKEAREVTDKALLGGIMEVPHITEHGLVYESFLGTRTPEEVIQHVHEAIDSVDGKGLIVGPGCVCDPKTSKENLHAVRAAVNR